MWHRLRLRNFFSLLLGWLGIGASPAQVSSAEVDRSPIAVAVASDGTRLLVANQTAGSVSLVDLTTKRVIREVVTGDRPSGVAISPDGRRGLVAHWFGYDVAILDLTDDRLVVEGRIEVGPEPRGVVIARDGLSGFIAVGASNEVVRIDLAARKVTGRVTVGREPRGLALVPDQSRLIVGNSRSKSITLLTWLGLRSPRRCPSWKTTCARSP